jgi:hypothetical protein
LFFCCAQKRVALEATAAASYLNQSAVFLFVTGVLLHKNNSWLSTPKTPRPHGAHAPTRARLAPRLCEDETVFDANMRLTETEHQYRANGEWHTLLGAHFQGSECKPHLVRSLGRPLLAKGGSVGRDDATP